MYNAWYVCFFSGCLLIFTGCERNSPSPVELKIDEEYGYSSIGDFSAANSTQPVHKISNNQTLFDVAYIYNIDPMNLAKINDIKPPYKVKNGQVLKLPNNNGGNYSSITSNEMQKQNSDSEETNDSIADLNEGTKKKDDIDEQFEKAGLSKSPSDKKTDEKKDASTAAGNIITKGIPPAATSEVSAEAAKTAAITATTSAQTKTKEATSIKTSRFVMPVNGKVLAKFGDMKDGFASEGLNIKAPKGSAVNAADGGTVIYVGNGLEEDYGNVVIIQHSDELITSYAHLGSISVKKDATVKTGQMIGTVGSSGDVKEPQLYFEVLKNNVPVDPYKYL